MAENKKSFTAYCDWKETFDSLPDEKAGQLIKHVFSYVNDENPQTDDILIKAVFAQIKATLKRDLKKWENKKLERSKAGILGNLKRYQKDLYQAVISDKMSIDDAQDVAKDRIATQSDTKLAVSDSVSVSVSVTDSVSDKKKNDIEDRKLKFASTLEPFLQTYGKVFLNDFYKYWTEPNKSNTKFRAELEKTWDVERRLETWARNDKNFKPPTKFGSSNQLPNAGI